VIGNDVRMATNLPDDVPIPDARLAPATADDAAELLVLQRCCWVDEALANETLDIPALHESLDDVRGWLEEWSTWCVRLRGRLVGAVRARSEGPSWDIGRLMVAPDLAGRGLGRWLLHFAETQAPDDAESVVLFTGARSVRNLTMYARAGFLRSNGAAPPGAVGLLKPVDRSER
jgi:GNAT superfamily N-acetyltransferase